MMNAIIIDQLINDLNESSSSDDSDSETFQSNESSSAESISSSEEFDNDEREEKFQKHHRQALKLADIESPKDVHELCYIQIRLFKYICMPHFTLFNETLCNKISECFKHTSKWSWTTEDETVLRRLIRKIVEYYLPKRASQRYHNGNPAAAA